MTVRGKLNLSVSVLIAIFLAAATFTVWAVSKNAEQTRDYTRMRELSQFTADIRTQIYEHLAASANAIQPPPTHDGQAWPRLTLDDIDVQIRLSQDDRERAWWSKVRGAVAALGDLQNQVDDPAKTQELIRIAELSLRELRSYYDLAQYDSIAAAARTSLNAQVAIGSACGLTVLLFLIYLIMVRDWLVKPLEVLKDSAETIGRGELGHRVPLTGSDELSLLARSIDDMAEHLAQHQSALLKARELSAIGELCANVAHGLRNPLAAIRSSAQLAEKRGISPHAAESMIRELAQQADRMDRRITRLFEFSRPLDLNRQRTSFRELARAALAQAHPLLEAREIRLNLEDLTGEAVWSVDREQLAHALAELITNAAHHTNARTQVTLRGEPLTPTNGSAPGLRIQVIDQGAGMSPATRDKAFDLFFTSRPEGSGMGLALVRRLIERHAGQISIESALGQGTKVTITLPAGTEPVSRDSRSVIPAAI